MKKILVAVFSIMILFGFATTTNVLAQKDAKTVVKVDGKSITLGEVNVNVDGKKVESDVPAVNYEGNTLIPIRFVSEELGAKVEWNDEARSAIIKISDKIIEIKIDSSKAIVNGKEQNIPNNAKAKLMSTSSSKSARTMVPLRFVSETLGAEVEWDDNTNAANIKSIKSNVPEEDTKSNKIKSVTTKNINGYTIPQIHIEAENELSYKNVYSQDPTKILIDLENVVLEKEINLNINNDVIKSVQAVQLSNTKDKKAVRLTVDLKKVIKHEVMKEKNILKFNFLNEIQSIEKQTINGKEAIVIKNAYASKSNSFSLSNPERLVVDMRNTNLTNVGSQISTDIIKALRLGQYTGKEYDPTEKVTRVVLDISENYENPKYITEERGNDLIIYVEGTKKPPVVTPPEVTPTPPVVTPPTPPVTPPSNTQKVVVVDAGHGGSDGGAGYNGVQEKDLALKVALKTRAKLESLGYKVIMTRSGDTYPSLADRYKLANDNNADAFISIHFNAATPAATGIETLYSTKNYKNQAFAQSIQNELIKNTGARDRGLKLREGLAVLKGTKCISALAELGFISNPNDVKEIVTDDYLEKCAKSLADGINKFLSKQ